MFFLNFFVGYYTVNDKLYCEADARVAKAAQVVSKEQNYQQLKQQQQQQPQQPPQQQTRQVNNAASGNWQVMYSVCRILKVSSQCTTIHFFGTEQQVLESNKAGASSNAEDFTKQFMSDLSVSGSGTGGGSG